MKKILFFIGYLESGGAEKVLCDIVSNLDKNKYDITVMTLFDTGVYIEEIKKYAKYKTCFTALTPGKNILKKIYNMIILSYRKILLNIIPAKYFYKMKIKEKYDVEIAFLEGVCTKIISSSCNSDSKKYAWVHIDMKKSNWSDKFYKNDNEYIECYKNFDKILCVSDNVKKSFIERFKINNNIYVQYNPLNEKIIREKALEEIDDVIINNCFKIITVGRLDLQKGYDRLVRIHKKLIDEGFKYELWVLGNGPQKQELERFIEENNLNDSFKLLGFKSNPYKYMKQSDLFVCSSRTEGFSTVATEATILGIPIVTTDCSGMTELLGNSEFGVISNNNIDDLYNAIKSILVNKDKYQYYKKKSIERSKDFTMMERINEIEELLDLDR